MSTLQQLAQGNPEWDLETFAQTVNDLLPQFLPPDEAARNRSAEWVNPRLVRYYTTQGVVDRPLRRGREARYTYRHLLQLLVVRRLLAAGYSTSAIQSITVEKSSAELEALLQGGVQLTVATANPALAFLQSVQARQPVDVPPRPGAVPLPPAPPMPAAQAAAPALTPGAIPPRWQRVEVLPGLEVHVREDFVPPSTPQEHENLLQLIAQRLNSLLTSLRSP